MAGSHSARTGTLPLRRCPSGAKTLALARGSRDDGQRQAHSREPRHRYSPCGSAFLSSCGMGSTGEALVEHPGVDKIAFTGSTEVGRAIRKATAQSHKKLSLELGGKSPFIIFEDSELYSAV